MMRNMDRMLILSKWTLKLGGKLSIQAEVKSWQMFSGSSYYLCLLSVIWESGALLSRLKTEIDLNKQVPFANTSLLTIWKLYVVTVI